MRFLPTYSQACLDDYISKQDPRHRICCPLCRSKQTKILWNINTSLQNTIELIVKDKNTSKQIKQEFNIKKQQFLDYEMCLNLAKKEKEEEKKQILEDHKLALELQTKNNFFQ